MNENTLWAIIAALFIGAPAVGLGVSEYLTHVEKMACIEKQGEFVKDICVFHAQDRATR